MFARVSMRRHKFSWEKSLNFNCRGSVAVIALIENIFSSRWRDRCSGRTIRDAVCPSIFGDGSGFRGLYRPEKFTVGNGKRIKRTDKKGTMTLFPRSLLIPSFYLFLSSRYPESLSLPPPSLPENNAGSYERKKDLFLAWIHSTSGNGAAEKSGLINQELIHRNIPRIRPVPFYGCYALSSVPSKSKIAHAAAW